MKQFRFRNRDGTFDLLVVKDRRAIFLSRQPDSFIGVLLDVLCGEGRKKTVTGRSTGKTAYLTCYGGGYPCRSDREKETYPGHIQERKNRNGILRM